MQGIEDAVEVAVGESHTCALRRNGELLCWGSSAPALYPGVRSSSQPRFQRIVAANVGSSASHMAALREDGVVFLMHYFRGFEVVQLPARGMQLESNAGESVVLLDNGEVYSLNGGSAPVRIPVTGTVASLAQGVPCLYLQDHSARCWGDWMWGVLGPGRKQGSDTGVPMPETGPARVVVDQGLARCSLSVSGKIDCWGTPRYHWRYFERPAAAHGNFMPFWGQVADTPASVQLAARRPLTMGNAAGCFIDDQGHAYAILDQCRKRYCRLELKQIEGVTDAVRVIPGTGCAVETSSGEAQSIEFEQPSRSPDPQDAEPQTSHYVSLRHMGKVLKHADGCYVTSEGTLYCGRNPRGPVNIPPAVDIADQSDRPKCAALRDGGLTCWSDSGFGKLQGTMDPLQGHVPKRLFEVQEAGP